MEFTKEVHTLGDLLSVLGTATAEELAKPIIVSGYHQKNIEASFLINASEPVFAFTEEYSADDE